MAKTRTISDVIKALGGLTAYARLIGRPHSTASEQKRSESIPVVYWPKILDAAREAGPRLDWITADALVTMHARLHSSERASA